MMMVSLSGFGIWRNASATIFTDVREWFALRGAGLCEIAGDRPERHLD
jgi:hypothetical protein